MAYSDTRSIVSDLEEQVEYWRQRAECAEHVLRGDHWNKKVPPLTLQQTRILRLLAKRDMDAAAIARSLTDDYPTITAKAIMVRVSQMRTILPEHLRISSVIGQHGAPYRTPDKGALTAFLGAA